uniref:Nucleotidyltransferase-like n=1 Tax=Oryza sativa subsp. japonica TaxID=39947 RepID=Q655S2_ORYSJ|nr:nucleotidyltransferase-like [Oryza sativa Japonica Group]
MASASASASPRTARQLADALTAHLSLYHAATPPPPSSSSPRAAILRWLASLSPPCRAAAATSLLTPAAAAALLSMLRRLRARGHSSFFVLHPPSPSSAAVAEEGAAAPTVLSRLSRGLLARAAEASRGQGLVFDHLLLFPSSPTSSSRLDAITVAEELLGDLDGFVAAMDEISGGRFLCGDGEVDLVAMVGEEFPELPWLKAKGYYVIEEFVANWVEIALRMSWAAAGGGGGGGGGGRKAVRVGKGVKEKAGLAANAFWREKGYVDWWMRLEPRVRARIMGAFFGKGTTALEIVYLKSNISNRSGDAIFFTKLMSAGTVADHILMKLRGILMVVSTESINLELIGDEAPKAAKKKDVEKISGGSRKGKKKSSSLKKLITSSKQMKDIGCSSSDSHDPKVLPDQQGPSVVCTTIEHASEDNLCKEIAPTPKVEQTVGLGDCKNQCNSKKRNKRKGKTKLHNLMKTENPGSGTLKTDAPHIATEAPNKPVEATHVSPHLPSYVHQSKSCIPKAVNCCDSSIALNGTDVKGIGNTKLEDTLHSPRVSSLLTTECSQSVKTSDGFSMNEQVISQNGQNESTLQPSSCLPSRSDTVDRNSVVATEKILPPVIPTNMFHSAISDNGGVMKTGGEYYVYNRNTLGGTSYEWPSVAPHHFVSPEMQQRPATTDRLHLDVGYRWPAQFEQPFLPPNHQMRNPPVEAGCNQVLSSLSVPLSFDWPPVFRGYGKLNQNNALGYDPLYTPQMQSSAWSGFHAPLIQRGSICNEKDRKYFGDSDPRNKSDVGDDTESYWFSEEESDGRGLSGRDINQYFGGGVMYWSPAEHAGTGFSRPPSLSSDDSAWAWHEADVSQVLDDIPVGIPCTYNANSVSSPPSTSVCSQNESPDPLPQSVGHSMTANGMNSESLQSPSSMQDSPEDKTISVSKSVSCGSEVIKGDTLPYAMLRPIVVPISRRPSRSEFKGGHDHRSPCVPSNRRDIPLVRRPPSPVVLSVPRVPRPPPPSPVGESRKRGFPIVRSGSSSPRHWGMRSLFTEDKILNRAQFCLDGPEVVWPSWGNKGSPAGTLGQSIEDTVLQDHLVKISQLSRDQHPDVALPLQPPDMLNCSSSKASLSLMHNALHEEIDQFCKQVSAENLVRKPYINWAVKRVTRCLQVLWPRSRTNLFGSNATGLALPTSDVDLVISLPPVRNLEPIKEAGILEGRNGIKETCLQHAARCLANQDWVRTDSLKTVENTAIPVIMLVAQVPCDTNLSSEYSSVLDSSHEQLSINVLGDQGSPSRSDNSSSEGSSMPMCSRINKDDGNVVQSIRLDISFKSPSHTGLQTTELVCELTQQFPAAVPLALILKKFLADRSLDHPYSGGLSSYCLVLLIVRFLQHEHHLGRPINQNLGSLLMDFLYFFGIDPIHIDDPLCPANNVGRNCFRIHQCIKAFADAFTVLENELLQFSAECYTPVSSFNLLKKIMPSIDFDEL